MSGERPEHTRDRFDSFRDQLLWLMCQEGWANAHAGDTASPMGLFYRISNTEADLTELRGAFYSDFKAEGEAALRSTLGHFMVRSDDQGFVDVFEHPTEEALTAEFDTLKRYYEEWARHE